MSFTPRSAARAMQSCSKHCTRSSSTSSTPSASSSSSLPPLKASLILSRQPLLTKTLHPMESAYYSYNANIRHALSNPISEDFYFKEGSLPLRRWRRAEWQYTKSTYGDLLAGPEPDAGAELEEERPVELVPRDHWEKQDAGRGEKSLERKPEEEVFCLVQEKKGGKWALPTVELQGDETLHGAVEGRITGDDGWFGGKTVDTWLVTKKPIGVSRNNEQRTFYLRSHILAGEPRLSPEAPWKSHAWLTKAELEAKLREQGAEQWTAVQRVFGDKLPSDTAAESS